jgi:hypothetical protein
MRSSSATPILIVAFGEGSLSDISRVARSPDPSYNIWSVGLRAMVQERPVRVERRLSAILPADVAGYSRLMHYDEED